MTNRGRDSVRLRALSLTTVIIATALSLTACGQSPSAAPASPSPSASPSPTTLTIAEAGQAYLAAVAPDNAAAKTFAAQASGWTSATSNATAEAQAAVLVAADKKFEATLEDTNWPTASLSDVHALAADMSQIDASLQTLSTVNFLDVDAWVQNFVSVDDQSEVQANIVRHDLGLPPAS